MTVKILYHQILNEIASASALEIVDKDIWLISDNLPYLFCLDKDFRVNEKFLLFQAAKLKKGVIQKKLKPDFEAMTLLEISSQKKLFLTGSGSSPQREKGYLFDLQSLTFESYDLKPLYEVLRQPEWIGDVKLNIEALAARQDKIYLFQRGNIKGLNLVFEFDLQDFMAFISQKTNHYPKFRSYPIELPKIEDYWAGLSGASLINENTVLFSASVEKTNDAIDDGELLGSFVGLLDLANLSKKPLWIAQIKDEKDENYLGKVEGICYRQNIQNGFQALAVTDSDGEKSEILILEIKPIN